MTKEKLLEIIKHLRKERQWTHEQMGEKLGLNRQAYERLENGRTKKLDFEIIEQIAEIFDMATLDLINHGSSREMATKLLEEAIQHFAEGRKKIEEAIQHSQKGQKKMEEARTILGLKDAKEKE